MTKTNKIQFNEAFRSITAFPSIELPRLVVLTGVNGAGKTHFLQALDKGALEVEGLETKQIRYFDWTSMFDVGDDSASRDEIRRESTQLTKQIDAGRTRFAAPLAEVLEAQGHEPGEDPWLSVHSQPSLLRDPKVLAVVEEANDALTKRLGLFAHWINWTRADPDGTTYLPLILEDFHSLAFGHLHRRMSTDAFGLGSVSAVIMAYFELELFNRLCALDEQRGREPEAPALDDQAFRERFGPPPCEVINDILARLDLPFEIEGPRQYTTTKYKAVLRRRSDGAEVPLSQLSSGEKMIMALALCTYASESRPDSSTTTTRLALFDEIDAPLHPSMVETMLGVINDIIIAKLGCSVILATHSATTVALAPEGSIYTMRRGQAGIHPQPKHQAIALLTREIPTLSLDFSGQRQVFVESEDDARHYAELYAICHPMLDSPRSLSFIGVGTKGHKGDQGTGCKAVLKVTETLAEQGNRSVFGLIDWDTTNTSSQRVLVLAEGRRYAIENCLLDPLPLLALVRQHGRGSSADALGFTAGESVGGLVSGDPQRLQTLIDKLQELLVRGSTSTEAIELRYSVAPPLRGYRAYLEHQGHRLAHKVVSTFALGNEAKLLDTAVGVLRANQGWVPIDLPAVFESLLEREP